MLTSFSQLNFQILSIERATHPAGFFSVPPRPYAALAFRLSGCGRFEIAGQTLISDAKSVLYLPANTSYKVDYTVNEIIVVHLLECNYSQAQAITPFDPIATQRDFTLLYDSFCENRSTFLAKSKIYAILAHLSCVQHPKQSQLWENCLSYFQTHFCDADFDLDRLCQTLYISRSTLQRELQRRFSLSPHQYLSKIRTEYAVQLLSSGNLRVKEVAAACGFPDEKYFSRIFKARYGVAPSKWHPPYTKC